MEREYIAFISYRHAPLDAAVAGTLHSTVEQYRIPSALRKNGTKRLGLIFRDQEELPVSSDLSADIRTALDHSQFLIVVCTPDAAASPWVNREIDYFLQGHDRQRILTVLAAGEPQEAFPWAVTHITHPDGTVEDVEPLAVDIRGEGRRTVLRHLRKRVVRLIAALIGCPYDELVMREQRRQRRRAAAVFSAAMAVALCFCGLLLFKNHQIDQKNLELEDRNLQLEQQKAAVLLRESELLVVNAEEALAQGDRAEAIRLAVSALPGGADGDRPYYASAERTLLSALDLFDEAYGGEFLLSTALEQSTPISGFDISGDGQVLATIDDFGTVNAFDTSSGEMRWSVQMEQTDTASFGPGLAVRCCAPISAFVCSYQDVLAAYSVSDGSCLWEADTIGSRASAPFLSEDRSRLVYLTSLHVSDPDPSVSRDLLQYGLVALSTQTGEELGRCLIYEFDWDAYLSGGTTFLFCTQAGAFSQDGARFAGSYYLQEEGQPGCTVYYYTADLETGVCQTVYSQELEDIYAFSDCVFALEFVDEGASLLAARVNGSNHPSIVLDKIRLEDGSLLWEAVSPPSETPALFQDSAEAHMACSNSRAALSYGNQAFFFDLQSGGYLDGTTESSEIIALEHISGTSGFGFAFSSGTSALAWFHDGGDGPALTARGRQVASLPANTEMAGFWGEAFFSTDFSQDTQWDSEKNFAVARPEGDSQSLILRRSRSAGGLSQPEVVSHSCEGSSLFHASVTIFQNGRAVIGPFSLDGRYEYIVLDTATQEQVGDGIPYDSHSPENVCFLSDASGYVVWDYDGLYLFDAASGRKTTLAENESVTLLQLEQVQYFAFKYVFSSARQSADGRVLTAQCGGEELRLWLDGQEQEAVPLPEGLRWSVMESSVAYGRILQAGGSGYVLLSHYEDEASAAMSGFAAYDTAAGVWTRFPDQAAGSSGRMICMGESTPIFCIADEDGSIRVYDMAAGRLAQALPLTVPVRSLGMMRLLLDDTVLLVLTQDSQLFLYDLASGEVLLHDRLTARSISGVSACVDEEGRRLYLALDAASPGRAGYLIDLRSWTKLMDIPEMLCYVPKSGRVLRYSYLPGTYDQGLLSCRIPPTDELAELGIQLIS